MLISYRDGATPQEQTKQILAIQPIFPGSHSNSKYTIPPYHAQKIVEAGTDDSLVDLSNDTSAPHTTSAASDSLAKFANAHGIPALIPTSAGIAPAGRIGGGLGDMRDLDQSLPQPKEAGSAQKENLSILRDDDELVDVKK